MLQQFLKFCVVGGSGVLVDFSITYLFKEILRVNRYVANSLGFIFAATSNYVLNRLWTFTSSDPNISGQYLKFVVIATVGLGLNNLIIYALNDKMGLNFYLSKLAATGVVMIWNFFMNYFITFAS